MRNVSIDQYEHLPRSVVVVTNDYPAGLTFRAHAHARGQFALASRGMITVSTPEGRWFVPPQRACWVPAGVTHEMTMSGPVRMLNTFVTPEASASAGLPTECCVYAVSALLRQLLDDAIDLPPMYDEDTRDGKLMALLLAEISAMPRLMLHAPLPADARLAKVCRKVFASPSMALDLDAVAAMASMSRRTFTRHFREEAGVSFAQWRHQVCLMAALERLSDGQSVTRVALDLGYGSPSAFTAAFRRVLGDAPSRYLTDLP